MGSGKHGAAGEPPRAQGRASALVRGLAALLVVAALALALVPAVPLPGDRPNIVLIVGDDHGYPYSGFMGDGIVLTPNLDRLAAEGVVFTTAYVTASVCEPSLRSLLTGVEPFSRLPGSFPATTPPARTLAGVLGRHGYRTFQAGKLWQPQYARAGFAEGTKPPRAEGGSFERAMGGRAGLAVGRSTMAPVLDFIDRNLRTPFFLFFAPMLPHRPWNAPDGVRARYAAVAERLTPSALAYYANVSRLDDAVGELVAHLDRKGLRSRTLLVYLSDNGFQQGPDEDFSPETLDHAKGSMAEMGFRTPIVFHWPGKVPAGGVRSDLVSALDVFPTLLDYAGVAPRWPVPGIDLRPAIEQGTPVPRSELVGVMLRARPIAVDRTPRPVVPRAYFVRSSRWHYLRYPDLEGAASEQLFDLESDPREQRDVAARHPERLDELRAAIERWQASPGGAGAPARVQP